MNQTLDSSTLSQKAIKQSNKTSVRIYSALTKVNIFIF